MGSRSTYSSIGGIERDILSNRPLPAVAIREETFLVVVEFLGRLGRELEVRSQDDGVDRADLLAKTAIDAFHHIDVEAGGPPRAVVASRPRRLRQKGREPAPRDARAPAGLMPGTASLDAPNVDPLRYIK